MFLYILVLTIIFIFGYIYLLDIRITNTWSKNGIPFYKGKFGLGYGWEFFTGDKPLFMIYDKIYKRHGNVPAIATRSFLNPVLILKDPENIQQITSGDFNAFSQRGTVVNGDVDLLADNILFMNGNRWKLTRQKFTPLFTSAKLRNMYYIMNQSAKDFVDLMAKIKLNEDNFNLLSTFCSAAVSAAVFGITTNSIMDSPLLEMAKKTFTPTFKSNLKFALANASNRLFNYLKIRLFSDHQDFFIGTMKKVLQARRESKVKTHDFADLCIEVQKNGKMRDVKTGYEIEPTDELMSAQAFFFFIAGVEPSAISMFFTLFELARNPNILKRVHDEIDEVFEKSEGEVTHEDIEKIEYLDRVIEEAMRRHPPISFLSRKCTQDTVLKVGNIPVHKGCIVQVPTYSIHHDPKYYPDPEIFNPDRFTEEAIRQRPHYTYMPFGLGNRMCLGMRYANLQVKTGLVHVMRHYTVQTDDLNTKVEYRKSPVQLKANNINFRFVRRLLN